MNDYIHINKAVRKYNKTRQTFYNYIKKWFVKTKKVNNKVYLLVSDIESLLNDYIPAQTIIEPNLDDNKTWRGWNIWSEKSNWMQIWIIDEVRNQSYDLKQHTNNLFGDLQKDIGKQLHNNINLVKDAIENKVWQTNRLNYEMQSLITKNVRKQNKILFWIYYLVFVSINIFIIRYIS